MVDSFLVELLEQSLGIAEAILDQLGELAIGLLTVGGSVEVVEAQGLEAPRFVLPNGAGLANPAPQGETVVVGAATQLAFTTGIADGHEPAGVHLRVPDP